MPTESFEEWNRRYNVRKMPDNYNSASPLEAGMEEFADLQDIAASSSPDDIVLTSEFNTNFGEGFPVVNGQTEMVAGTSYVVDSDSTNHMPLHNVQALVDFNQGPDAPIAISREDYEQGNFAVGEGGGGNGLDLMDHPLSPYSEGFASPEDGTSFTFPQATSFSDPQNDHMVHQHHANNPNVIIPMPLAPFAHPQANSMALAPTFGSTGSYPPQDQSYIPFGFNTGFPAFHLPALNGTTNYDTLLSSFQAQALGRTTLNTLRPTKSTMSITPAGSPVNAHDQVHLNRIAQANNAAYGPQPPVLRSQRPPQPQYTVHVILPRPTDATLNDLRISILNKPTHRTKLEILAAIGEIKLALNGGTVLDTAPTRIEQTVRRKVVKYRISTEQFAQTKRTEPMLLLTTRYGAQALQANPPTQEFLAAMDRRLSGNPAMDQYVLPRRMGYDDRNGSDLPYDFTTYHPGHRNWDGESSAVTLPDCFYRNHPDFPTLKWNRNPPAIVGANGEIVKIGDHALYDFEILPDKIGRNEFWWFYELCFRLDPRIGWNDILIRMIRCDSSPAPKVNQLQMQCRRGREAWGGMLAVVKAKSKNLVRNVTTTRGRTPGLIDPQGPDDHSNRVPLMQPHFSGFKCFVKKDKDDKDEAEILVEDLTALKAEEEQCEAMFNARYPPATVPGSFH